MLFLVSQGIDKFDEKQFTTALFGCGMLVHDYMKIAMKNARQAGNGVSPLRCRALRRPCGQP
ncbi:hypothetical protein [Vogesella oryzae]|uniref:hypothetical protein n=1 Tax=Vogesella oryzae TaxID=1735285 RepID=UPI0015825132|nr:hypothetical protein [Vogesella oryzae]